MGVRGWGEELKRGKNSLQIYSHFILRTTLEVGRFGIIISISRMRNSELTSIINVKSVSKKNDKKDLFLIIFYKE